MYRYDAETGDIVEIRSELFGATEIVVSDSGGRVAWRVGADVQVAYSYSGEIISLQDSFRFCNDTLDDCLFNSFRFITSEAREMSGDGIEAQKLLWWYGPRTSNQITHCSLISVGSLSRFFLRSVGSFSPQLLEILNYYDCFNSTA